jgi:pimeloyl-ACP methyl ester carboxylesterase
MLWVESGGTGSRTVLLLHGLGATAAVWSGLRTALEQRADVRWLAADLPGHGRSAWEPTYSVGSMAARLAEHLGPAPGELFIVGHSLGAYLALALASGWFRVRVAGVLGIGPKISWSQEELQGAQALAGRSVREYPTAEEAWARYRRVSGLGADIAAATEVLAGGIARAPGGWRLAQDPRTFAVAGAPFRSLAASAGGRIILARGASDPMVSLAELAEHAAVARELARTGHNAHVEAPGAVLALLAELFADS